MTILMVCGTFACTAGAQGGPEPLAVASARVIVRFKATVTDPTDRVFLASLATRANVARIGLIRPMSGDAYVMEVACTDLHDGRAGDPCAAAIARLGATDAVAFVEADRREKIR